MTDLFSLADELEDGGHPRRVQVDNLTPGDLVHCRVRDVGPAVWAEVQTVVIFKTNFGKTRIVLEVKDGEDTRTSKFLPGHRVLARPAA